MTHYQSAVDLTVGCIIVQRRHLSEASGSGRRNSSSQNGLIKPREVSDSTREMENNRLIKKTHLRRRRRRLRSVREVAVKERLESAWKHEATSRRLQQL